jgi:hypothetical protein
MLFIAAGFSSAPKSSGNDLLPLGTIEIWSIRQGRAYLHFNGVRAAASEAQMTYQEHK